MSNETKIAVVEGKWFKGKNTSVRGLFDLISDINCGSPHKYHYEMFNNDTAFQEIIARLASTDNIHNVYIAAHGSEEGLYGSNGKVITLTKVRNSIKKINKSHGKLSSIYFGSCNFGNDTNLEDLLLNGDIQLRWVAGYTESVDFIKSSVLDALFWNLYISNNSSTPLKKIKEVCDELLYEVPGLIKELGFKVLAYDGKFDHPVIDLTETPNLE